MIAARPPALILCGNVRLALTTRSRWHHSGLQPRQDWNCWPHTQHYALAVDMNGKEIIDLTSSEDHAVIILDSGDENEGPSTKRSRQTAPNRSDAEAEAQIDGEGSTENGAEDSHRKRKRRGRGVKRRKHTRVGSEEGEVVEIEVTEDSEQVSRAQSKERNTTGESSRRPISGKVADDIAARNLLDRLADAEHIRTPDSEPESRPSNSEKRKRKKKKRKRDDDDMEANGDDPLDSLFFVDDTPAQVPESSKFSNSVTLSGPAADKANKQGGDDKPSLLLPGHVSVFEGTGDGPIQMIVAPEPMDSEEEDYIEYLDYDDDRRVRQLRCLNMSFAYSSRSNRLQESPGISTTQQRRSQHE